MTSKRVSAKDKVKKDNLFNPTVEVMQNQISINEDRPCGEINKQQSNHVNNETSKQDYRRQTYFLTEDLINAITFKSAFDKMDKSEIVREALKQYIEDKYFNMN